MWACPYLRPGMAISDSHVSVDTPDSHHATGPRTPEGKQKSSRNATTHGCCSKTVILPGESQEEFDQLLEDWTGDYQPAHAADRVLVEKAVRELWFMMRNTSRYAAFEQSLHAVSPLDWTEEQHQKLERFIRYKTTAERSFQRASTTLEQIHRRRDRVEACAASPVARTSKPSTEPEITHEPDVPEPDLPEQDLPEQDLPEQPPPPFIHGLEQWVDITRGEDGEGITAVEPSNEQLLEDLAVMKPPAEMVRRQFYFHDGVPDEYAWCCQTAEERDTRTYGVQRITIETWLAALEHEKAVGRLIDTGKDLPPPNQISDCPCWCLICQRNIAIRERRAQGV